MRIVIDARLIYWTGVGRYLVQYLAVLPTLDHENEYFVLMRRADWNLWEPTTPNFHKIECNINPYTIGEQTRLAGIVRRFKPDLVHFPAVNAAPLFYFGRRLVTIHDITLLEYDTSRGNWLVRQIKRQKQLPFRLSIWWQTKFATAINTPTQFVKDELIRRYHIHPDKVTVTYLSANKELAAPEPTDRFGLGKQFILNIGNCYPYKNLGVVLQAYKLLGAKYPNLQLICSCRPGYFRDQLEKLADELGVRDKVFFPGYVSDGEMISLYREAVAYVYPSYSEGFGLETLESMIEGTPVISSNASCLPEIGGDAAVYFDPSKPEELAARIDEVLSDKKLYDRMVADGYKQAAKFNWPKTSRETLMLYQQLLKQK